MYLNFSSYITNLKFSLIKLNISKIHSIFEKCSSYIIDLEFLFHTSKSYQIISQPIPTAMHEYHLLLTTLKQCGVLPYVYGR